MKKSFIKRAFVIALSGIMTLSLVACGNSSKKTEGDKATNAKAESGSKELTGKITVASWNDAADSLSEIAKAFMKANPKAEVEISYVDSDYTKIMPQLASGTGAPDVIQTQQRDFPSFMNKFPDQFVDVTDMLKESKDKGDFASFVWPQITSTKDQKVYATPWDIGPSALYYRKDMFKEAGVDPNTIQTWDQYVEAGKKITKHFKGKTKMVGFGYNNGYDFTVMLLNQLGGQFYDQNKKVDLSNKEMLRVAKLERRMIDEGITMDLPNEWNDRITAIQNNQIATVPYPVWYAGTLVHSVKDQSGKWGLMKLPAFDKGGNQTSNYGGSVLAITKSTKNEKLAKEFVKFALMTDEGNVINLKYGLFPSYKPSYKHSSFNQKSDYFGIAVGEYFAQLTEIPKQDYGAYFLDVTKSLKDAMAKIRIQGEKPEKALKDASDAVNKKIQ